MMIITKKPKIYVQDDCFPRERLKMILSFIPQEDLTNLKSINMRIYGNKELRKRISNRRWVFRPFGEYNHNKLQVYVYLGPIYEDAKYAFPFFRKIETNIIRTLFHEIGHHKENIIKTKKDNNKKLTGTIHCIFLSEQYANNYMDKQLTNLKLQKYLESLPETGNYITRRRYKQRKQLLRQKSDIPQPVLMRIIHEIRQQRLNCEYAPSDIIYDTMSCPREKYPTNLLECPVSNKNIYPLYPEGCPYKDQCNNIRKKYFTTKYVNEHARKRNYGKIYIDKANRKFRYFTCLEYKKILKHLNAQISKITKIQKI